MILHILNNFSKSVNVAQQRECNSQDWQVKVTLINISFLCLKRLKKTVGRVFAEVTKAQNVIKVFRNANALTFCCQPI